MPVILSTARRISSLSFMGLTSLCRLSQFADPCGWEQVAKAHTVALVWEGPGGGESWAGLPVWRHRHRLRVLVARRRTSAHGRPDASLKRSSPSRRSPASTQEILCV